MLPPSPPFFAVSPAPGTAISFGFEAKADSLVPAPVPPALPGTLRNAPGATVQGHATWVDHSTSPPRTITLTTPLNFSCSTVTGVGSISGWGTDSTILGPVFVIFNTSDSQVSGSPLGDEVRVRVLLAPPPPPPAVPPFLYWANATASGEVVQHSCQ
ncbi:MAG: hypothetical protein HY680_07965 [Chloroflexi bacterium]|nr:hypothetical protein [Chloroflexota bacterium]